MNDGSPTLEVGFTINTGGAFAELLRFSQMFDDKTVQFVRQAAMIEKASGGMVAMGRATAEMRTFGAEATRELQSVARDTAKAEKAGEAMVRQLERQNAVYGKTRDELRSLKAEELAVAAARVGNTDLANRLRAEEAMLFEKQFAAARRAQQQAEALAQDQLEAAQKAVAAKQAEEQAVRSAALAYQLFEAAARRGGAAMREAAAAAQAVALAKKEQELRSAALGYQMFEAAARRGAAATRSQ